MEGADYILQKAIRMQTEVWTLLDGGSQLYITKRRACMKQGLGGSQSYDPLKMMKYISMVVAMKGSTCLVRPRRSLLRREALKYPWLSIHIRDPMMKERSGIFRAWNL
jgi:hypothetical protein